MIFRIATNLAGKAINISQTTAAHAMTYKLVSLLNIPHGYAVALTLPYLWEQLINDGCRALVFENITFNDFKEVFSFMNLS